MDVYDFGNEIVSPPTGRQKVRGCSKYQEYVTVQLPVLRARYPFLDKWMLRDKCKERWRKMTGQPLSQETKPRKKSKPKRRVSFNESAEVRQFGGTQSQPQTQRRSSHFSPLKSEPVIPTCSRYRNRRTTIEVVTESPISKRLQELEIGRRGPSDSAGGGDRIIDQDDEVTFPFPHSLTPEFQDTSPSNSPEVSFSRNRSSDLFRPKQKTYTGISGRRSDPVPVTRSPAVAVRPAASSAPRTRLRVAQSEAVRVTGSGYRTLVSEAVPLVPRRAPRVVMRILESDLIPLVRRHEDDRETPKTHRTHKTPLLHPIPKKKVMSLKANK